MEIYKFLLVKAVATKMAVKYGDIQILTCQSSCDKNGSKIWRYTNAPKRSCLLIIQLSTGSISIMGYFTLNSGHTDLITAHLEILLTKEQTLT